MQYPIHSLVSMVLPTSGKATWPDVFSLPPPRKKVWLANLIIDIINFVAHKEEMKTHRDENYISCSKWTNIQVHSYSKSQRLKPVRRDYPLPMLEHACMYACTYLFQLNPELLYFQPDNEHSFDCLQLLVPLIELISKRCCSHCPL